MGQKQPETGNVTQKNGSKEQSKNSGEQGRIGQKQWGTVNHMSKTAWNREQIAKTVGNREHGTAGNREHGTPPAPVRDSGDKNISNYRRFLNCFILCVL